MDSNRPTASARPARPEPSRSGWRVPARPNYAGRYVVTAPARKEAPVIVLRREIGDVLRGVRQHQGRTLREVSSAAQVSLGYLSEVERGQKEASSELLASICAALDVPLSVVLREVSDRIAESEGVAIPDTVSELLERTMLPVR
ncbi:MAG: helix-turn-helix transcriptional regulator [Actinomycetales bacterium]|nr:helix-turn-helix transcriptional regulator [Actinomycetales bacterium]